MLGTALKTLTLIFLLFFYGLFLTHKIDLTTADLGRHLKNGELLFQNPELLKTNFYSYTNPDYPVINHHWLSGFIFRLIHGAFGFEGLSIFFIFISLAAFLIFFYLASQNSSFETASLISILVIPLLAERTEIRPEIFSYLFAGIFLLILWQWSRGKLSKRWLWALPFLQILWANSHIYFFIGPLLVCIFLLGQIFGRGQIVLKKLSELRWAWSEHIKSTLFMCSASGARAQAAVRRGSELTVGSEGQLPEGTKNLSSLLLLTVVLANFMTPFGWEGALEPLKIFREYGYDLVENKSVWFLETLGFQNPTFLFFKAVFILLIASFVFAVIYGHRKSIFVNLFFAFFMAAAALFATRNFTLFGYFALPIISANFSFIRSDSLKIKSSITLAVLFVLALFVQKGYAKYWPYWDEFGIGLEAGVNDPAAFFKKEKIKGPIFNNYDIGSYLVYHLYPEKVFVENRPEAYPVSFFRETLIPMQENEAEWEKQDSIYRFNVIFFSHRDNTPWGQKFLKSRLADKNWAPVFLSPKAVIFLKRNSENKSLIQRSELRIKSPHL